MKVWSENHLSPGLNAHPDLASVPVGGWVVARLMDRGRIMAVVCLMSTVCQFDVCSVPNPIIFQ